MYVVLLRVVPLDVVGVGRAREEKPAIDSSMLSNLSRARVLRLIILSKDQLSLVKGTGKLGIATWDLLVDHLQVTMMPI